MSGTGVGCTTRLATADDIAGLAALFVEMVRYYDDPPTDETVVVAALRRHVFTPGSGIEVLLAEIGGRPVGFASLSPLFPVDGVLPALYMKELYVSAATRSSGVGRALLVAVARLARERGCVRVNWTAASDNGGAIRFYQGIGAINRTDTRLFQLDTKGIAALADSVDR